MKVLVIGPSWVGDMMMSQSFYRTLKARYPQAIIDVMAPTWCSPLLSYMPEINETIPMPLIHGSLGISARRQLGYSLREKCYERSYVLPNSFKSALIPFFAGIPRRTGWRGEMRYGLLNDLRLLNKAAWPMMVERYVALAYDKGEIGSAKELPKPLLWPHLQIKEGLKSHTCSMFGISSKRQIIGLCPGAEFGPAKRWPHYHYAELAKQLVDEGYQILLFGSTKDHRIGKKIMSILNNTHQLKWCCNLVGKTLLEQAIILIASCKVIVSNDSGLMHIAAALDRSLLVLYGPSSPNFTPPLSHKARVIRLITGYYKVRRDNATEGYHQGLINIQPQHVFKELNKLLLYEENRKCEY